MYSDIMKTKNVIAIVVVVILLVMSSSVITYLVITRETPTYVDPYDYIREENTNYTKNIQLLLNETATAISTYRETGNLTYLSYAGTILNIAMNNQIEYHKWFTYNVSKEITDHELDMTIFRNVYDSEYMISYYLNILLIEQSRLNVVG